MTWSLFFRLARPLLVFFVPFLVVAVLGRTAPNSKPTGRGNHVTALQFGALATLTWWLRLVLRGLFVVRLPLAADWCRNFVPPSLPGLVNPSMRCAAFKSSFEACKFASNFQQPTATVWITSIALVFLVVLVGNLIHAVLTRTERGTRDDILRLVLVSAMLAAMSAIPAAGFAYWDSRGAPREADDFFDFQDAYLPTAITDVRDAHFFPAMRKCLMSHEHYFAPAAP